MREANETHSEPPKVSGRVAEEEPQGIVGRVAEVPPKVTPSDPSPSEGNARATGIHSVESSLPEAEAASMKGGSDYPPQEDTVLRWPSRESAAWLESARRPPPHGREFEAEPWTKVYLFGHLVSIKYHDNGRDKASSEAIVESFIQRSESREQGKFSSVKENIKEWSTFQLLAYTADAVWPGVGMVMRGYELSTR